MLGIFHAKFSSRSHQTARHRRALQIQAFSTAAREGCPAAADLPWTKVLLLNWTARMMHAIAATLVLGLLPAATHGGRRQRHGLRGEAWSQLQTLAVRRASAAGSPSSGGVRAGACGVCGHAAGDTRLTGSTGSTRSDYCRAFLFRRFRLKRFGIAQRRAPLAAPPVHAVHARTDGGRHPDDK